MRKIFYLLLVFVLILFACSAGCTSSTAEKEVLTQEEFQAVMDARAATSSPTTVSTPVPIQTPLAPDFKYSVGDLLAETEEINSGVFIVDYQASTDKYLVMLHYRDSNEPQGIGIDEQLLWKDRVEINERYKYYVAHLDAKVTVVSPTPETAPTIAPTVKPTTVATPPKEDGYLRLDISSSRYTIGNLLIDIADDIDYMDFQSLKTHGERLEQKAQSDYNVISKYTVSSDYQNLKTRYLRVLDASKNAGKYSKLAAEEFLKGNDDKCLEYMAKAQGYMEKSESDLNAVAREMGW